jgi:hypothetical protein
MNVPLVLYTKETAKSKHVTKAEVLNTDDKDLEQLIKSQHEDRSTRDEESDRDDSHENVG